MHTETSRRRNTIPAPLRDKWTRQDLLTIYEFKYCFWARIPHGVLPYIRDGKSYQYDAADVRSFLDKLKHQTLAELTIAAGGRVKGDQAPRRKRGRPAKVRSDV